MKIAILTYFLLFSSPDCIANHLRVMSFNLHGYHPTGESSRFDQINRPLKSDLYYFTPAELARGNKNRLKKLARDIKSIKPDLLFLQEVAAGNPHDPDKNCHNFYDQDHSPIEGKNTALRLKEKLEGYQAHLACRGNIGWVTQTNTFDHFSVLKANGEKVFSSGDNPYPFGLFVEGFAILTGHNIEILELQKWNIDYNYLQHKVFVQMVRFKKRGHPKWFIALNVHLGHKIRHLEQSMAIRSKLLKYLQHLPKNDYGGVLIAGDFNAFLETVDARDLSMDGWFLTKNFSSLEDLSDKMKSFNYNSLKKWATIPYEDFIKRGPELVRNYYYQSNIKKLPFLTSLKPETCKQIMLNINYSCDKKDRIDYILRNGDLRAVQSTLLYPHHNWQSVENSISDHPAILLDFLY